MSSTFNALTNNGLEVVSGEYYDAGLIITSNNLAAGASTPVSQLIAPLYWVRYVIVMWQSDQTLRVYRYLQDQSGQQDGGGTFISSLAASPSAYSSYCVIPATAQSSGVLGYGAKFQVQNTGAAPATVVNVRMQFIGM